MYVIFILTSFLHQNLRPIVSVLTSLSFLSILCNTTLFLSCHLFICLSPTSCDEMNGIQRQSELIWSVIPDLILLTAGTGSDTANDGHEHSFSLFFTGKITHQHCIHHTHDATIFKHWKIVGSFFARRNKDFLFLTFLSLTTQHTLNL